MVVWLEVGVLVVVGLKNWTGDGPMEEMVDGSGVRATDHHILRSTGQDTANALLSVIMDHSRTIQGSFMDHFTVV